MAQTNILLEVGTNELEIVEFYIQERGRDLEVYTGHYGVNVAKVLEIIRMPDVTEMPGSSHPSIIGAFKHRGRVLPLVDLSLWLGKNPPDQVDQKVIITEFNNEVTGFLVHGVNRIHRMSWESIEPPSGYVSEFSSHSITGVVKMDERIIFVLDLEKIVTELNPHMEMRLDEDESASIEGKYKALVADDSNIVRQMLKKQLEKGRFEVHLVNNGKEAWDLLEKIKTKAAQENIPISHFLQAVVTDIEMPSMDGLTLTKKIKDDPELGKLPVILFSSLISDKLRHKGEVVGADDQVTKPEISQLTERTMALIREKLGL